MATATVPGYRARTRAPRRACCQPKRGDAVQGVTHASTGLVLGAVTGLLTTAPHAHGIVVAQDLGRDLLYGLVVAATALLPDADHPQASFAFSAGALSHGISHLVAVLFGGHRAGMHSFFGIGLMMLATASCTQWWPNHWALGIFAAFLAMLLAAGLAVTGFAKHGLEALLLGCVAAAVAVACVRADLWWLVALGMALHIFEDEFSGHGCALFWPAYRHRIGGDGKQPAKKRAPSSTIREARGQKRQGHRGPAARKVAARATRAPARKGPVSMCLRCLAGDCEVCTGRCACPQPATSHPNRGRRKPPAPPELPEKPPY